MSSKNSHLRWTPPSVTVSEVFNSCLFKGLHGKVDTVRAKVVHVVVGNWNCVKSCKTVRKRDYAMENAHVRFLFTSWVVSETKEWAQPTREFSDTNQRVNKNRAKHFPCCNVFISYWEFFCVVFGTETNSFPTNGAMKAIKDGLK